MPLRRPAPKQVQKEHERGCNNPCDISRIPENQAMALDAICSLTKTAHIVT